MKSRYPVGACRIRKGNMQHFGLVKKNILYVI